RLTIDMRELRRIPSVPKDTLIVLPIINKKFTKTKDEWDVRIDPGTKGKDLVLQVFIPATAPVGIWRLNIRSGLKDRSQGAGMAVFKDETDVFILFNPWCKEDLVYLEDDKDREEYVMNDKGKVYLGSFRKPRGRPWAFGQFEDVVLPVACYILELSKYPHSERGNPVKVVRAISGGVNDIDDEGILVGRWDGEYGDGVAPFKWTGSVRILEEYLKGGFRPVKYGQCWVFSAVTTTICRALGIPCRSVTNYVSAHDTNSSLTIDKFFSKAGDEIEGGPDGENWDSIWNFHVWNDVWMARPDLPPGYGGWQAIDATPQEESEDKMQCGPASLEAVRRGDIGLGYDCPFVFAEVNADVMHWGEDDESDWGYKRMKMIQFHIGRSVVIRNESDEPRTVSAALTAKSIYYTGVHHSIIKKAEGVIKLEPQKEQEIALTVDYKEYWKRLQEHCMIKMYTICRVKETGQTFTEEDDFQVEKPSLDIEVPKEAKRGEQCEVIFSFTNPLDDELTDLQLSIDGSGLLRPRAIKVPGTVIPKGKFAYNFRFSPKVHGNRKIVASFNSKELFDISGMNSIVVVK
ncbi:Hemocyte protein-glutamine gamma-glutamyltransferase, partial [Armadillidium vulgare]